ncbi:MAG: UPF0345 protein [Verrucomicrobiota bacterium]|nr:MAG: UPF0345 protein [Verrucomicrobiota bacterium]
MSNIKFENVTVHAKANIYFDGKVVSHSIVLEDGSKKTLGTIYPGSYHFNTEQAEKMEIITGKCEICLGQLRRIKFTVRTKPLRVEANSGFTIEVREGTCEYICSFID